MLQINEVTLLGYVGRNPEVRTRETGDRVARFTLATNYRRSGDDKPDRTMWHRIVAFDSRAAFAADHVRRGAAVLLRGRIEYRTFPGDDGVDRVVTEIIVGAGGMINLLAPGRDAAATAPADADADAGGEAP